MQFPNHSSTDPLDHRDQFSYDEYQSLINPIFPFIQKIQTKCKFLGSGRNRAGYLHKNCVFKIPLLFEGIEDNWREDDYYSKDDLWPQHWKSKFAKCRIVNKIILVMEYCKPNPDRDMPDWVNFIDCQQVGYNRKNKLLTYDYASQ